MDRKEFIKSYGIACLGGSALSVFLQSCASTNYFAQTSLTENKIILPKAEFIKTQDDKTSQRKYVLVKTDQLNFPVCIYKSGEENYTALLMECTHKGCELQPQGDFLICPCHGSEFNNKGIAQNPPAEENLRTFLITTDHENIYIQL